MSDDERGEGRPDGTREGEERSAATEAGISPEPGLVLRAEAKLGLLDDLDVVAFPAHGAPGWLRVKGRLIERRALGKTGPDSGLLRNVKNAVRRFASDEIPGARVRASYRGGHWETVTDEEGYFSFRIEPGDGVEPGWHDVPLEVVPPVGEQERLDVTAPVLVPSPDAGFGVVSDLDDTVLKTSAHDLLKKWRTVLATNARTRPAFPGAAALYRALHAGPTGEGLNPFFYVSRSGWNLFDFFDEFMERHDFPRGPFFMQDLSIVENPSTHIAQAAPKLESVGILLENYPGLPFLLVGDSGQEDPETYRRVVDRHPDRILAIYIRDVTPDVRDEEVRAIAREVEAKGVPMVLARDSLAVAEHAVELGFIHPDAVEAVRDEVERERREEGE